MDTKIMIAGGVGVLGLVGILLVRSRRTASNSAPVDNTAASSGLSTMLYGPPSISGGISSGDTGGYSLPGLGMNSSGDTMSVASMDQLLAGFFANSTLENMARIQSSTYTADTSSLSGVNYGQFGGQGSVTHNPDGTVVTIKNNGDPAAPDYSAFVDSVYQSELGRAPDAGGKAFYLDSIKRGVTPYEVSQSIKNSAEAAARAAAAQRQSDAQRLDSYTNSANNYTHASTTITDPKTGVITTTMGKTSA